MGIFHIARAVNLGKEIARAARRLPVTHTDPEFLKHENVHSI